MQAAFSRHKSSLHLAAAWRFQAFFIKMRQIGRRVRNDIFRLHFEFSHDIFMIKKLFFGGFSSDDTRSFIRLTAYIRPYKWRIAAAVVAIIGVAATESYLAAFIAPLVNQGFSMPQAAPQFTDSGHWFDWLLYWKNRLNYWIWGSEYKIWAVPLFLVFLIIVRGIGRFAGSYLMAWVGLEAISRLRQDMFRKMLLLPSYVQQEESSGMIANRIVNQTSNAISGASTIFVTLVRDSLIVAGLIGVLLYLNWQLSLVVLFVFPCLTLLTRYYRKRLKNVQVSAQKSTGQMINTLNELHSGHRMVKMYGGYDNARQRFDEVNRIMLQANKKITQANTARSPISELIASIALAIVIFIALWQSRSGTTTIGEFMAFIVAMLQMVTPLKNLSNISIPLQAILLASDDVCAFLDMPDEADNGRHPIERATGRITFDHVGLRYPNSKTNALDGFTLDIRAGEKVALVGRSGSGKTTAVNLLPRFLEADAGCILLDGIDIHDIPLAQLRRQFALVSQDVFLFDDTLYNNVVYGRPGAADAEVESALKAANLWDMVQNHPQGWHMPLGSNGNQLSGGQRQRVSIARAILKDAPVLLLDEATSALDNESERLVQEALERLMHNRTSIIIAHRLTTIENADHIVVMDGGRIVEQGTHQSLLRQQGFYAALSRLPSADR